MAWLCWECQSSGGLRAPPGTCCGSSWVPCGSSGTTQSTGMFCRTQHQTDLSMDCNNNGVGNNLCFPSIIADSSQTFCLKSFLPLSSRSSCFLPLTPSCLGCSSCAFSQPCFSWLYILHCPNSSKFHVFCCWGCVQLIPTQPSSVSPVSFINSVFIVPFRV